MILWFGSKFFTKMTIEKYRVTKSHKKYPHHTVKFQNSAFFSRRILQKLDCYNHVPNRYIRARYFILFFVEKSLEYLPNNVIINWKICLKNIKRYFEQKNPKLQQKTKYGKSFYTFIRRIRRRYIIVQHHLTILSLIRADMTIPCVTSRPMLRQAKNVPADLDIILYFYRVAIVK